MDDSLPRIQRRKLLAGFGALGVGSLGGLSVLTQPPLTVEQTTSTGNGLVLEWTAMRNGQPDNGAVQNTGSAFTYSVGNLLPEDHGTLTVQLSLTDGTPDTQARFAFDLTARTENSLIDPEETAGDDSPGQGELGEFVTVDVFYDTGTLGVDMWGARNGTQDLGEGLIDPDASGTLVDVAAALPDDGPNGVALDADPGTSGTDPLTDTNSIAITFGWAFPDAANINQTQSDAVAFDLTFYAEAVT
jgi:hypothetical protein